MSTHQVVVHETFCSVTAVGKVEPSNYRVRVSLVRRERPLVIVDDVHVQVCPNSWHLNLAPRNQIDKFIDSSFPPC